jgi:predicted nucleic acid-binding protein
MVARTHARLSAELAAKGSPVGAHDLLTAATALAVGYDVATRDERNFPKIPGLRVLRWRTRLLTTDDLTSRSTHPSRP